MAKDNYDRGVRDGENDSVAGDPRKSIASELLTGYSSEELADIKDYDQGRDHGKKSK